MPGIEHPGALRRWLRGGDWRLFDRTHDISPDQIAIISRGRDATSAALTRIFGRVSAVLLKVTCEIVQDLKA
ncbi:MAG: hypothetical protein ABIQ12_02030 [Opitutaceae bacterium]